MSTHEAIQFAAWFVGVLLGLWYCGSAFITSISDRRYQMKHDIDGTRAFVTRMMIRDQVIFLFVVLIGAVVGILAFSFEGRIIQGIVAWGIIAIFWSIPIVTKLNLRDRERTPLDDGS